MAYYEKGTVVSSNQLLQAFETFLAANGWTIDWSGTYNTSYYRVHAHKGICHIDCYGYNTTTIYVYPCTGYASGSAPAAQPGVSSNKSIYAVAGCTYRFVSVEEGVYVGTYNNAADTYVYWGFFGYISEKIGAWSDGILAITVYGSVFFPSNAYASTAGTAQLYYNGVWSTYNAAAGGIGGNNAAVDGAFFNKQPNRYNLGIVPFPLVVFLINATDSTKYHPMGYVPGVYRASGGDVYGDGEEIIIGSDTYLIQPHYYNNIVDSTDRGCLLFKLGA